jgi:hypothetical protein
VQVLLVQHVVQLVSLGPAVVVVQGFLTAAAAAAVQE